METKKCNKCGEVKTLSMFLKIGLVCKMCTSIYHKEYKKKNKKYIKEHYQKYYKKNKVQLIETKKEYYKKNKEHIKEYKNELRKKNSKNLKDVYIKILLGISNKDEYPKELIELKRVQMQIKRFIK